MTLNLRKNVALAFDGGGVRGIIPAKALRVLEKELGDKPLVKSESVKVITGTSTGALIAAAVAIGMKSDDIVALYHDIAPKIFTKDLPLPRDWENVIERVLNRNRNDQYIALLKDVIGHYTGKKEITLGELREQMRPDQVLVITTMNLQERRTRFLKTNNLKEEDKNDPQSDQNWTLWEAVVASSAAPTYFPVFVHPQEGTPDKPLHYYADGGTGSYNNPAYIAAIEAVEYQGLPRRSVSVLSFGTGFFSKDAFKERNPDPTRWNIIDWATKVPIDLMMSDAARLQSLDLLHDFVRYKQDSHDLLPFRSVDFRRFQVCLDKVVELDDSSKETLDYLDGLGTELVQRIEAGDYLTGKIIPELASVAEDDKQGIERCNRIDPEGIAARWQKIITSKRKPASLEKA